jgi:CTP:molybdopterin cytidylyltransferase MocA
VLFDRVTFDDLAGLSGDTGGRAIFDRHEVTFVDWDDPNLLAGYRYAGGLPALMELE